MLLLLATFLALPVPKGEAPLSTVVLDRNGKVLKAFLAEDQRWRMAFGEDRPIPVKLEKALLAAEDRRFRWHPGVDPLAVMRALAQNLKAGKRVSGASTLTMQAVRLMNPRPRTWGAKACEAMLALRLDFFRSKDDILRLYLTHAPYGGNVVGVRAASLRFFGVEAEDLTWAQACTLVVLPRSPSSVNLQSGRSELKRRRDRLLDRLEKEGILDAATRDAARREPLPERSYPMPDLAPHFARALAREHSGNIVPSTLDPALERTAQAMARQWSEHLALYGVRNVALIVAETPTGKVRAYVGSQDFDDKIHGGEVDGVRAPRSSGSILKPFLYALMVQGGRLHPRTLLPDVPMRFGNFEPVNAGETYAGAATVQDALTQSLNVPAVYALREYGVEPFQTFLREAGVSSLFRAPEGYGLSLAVGGAEVDLWDMAALYRGLGRGGLFAPLTAVEARNAPAAERRLLSPGAAWLTLEMLKEVQRPGMEYSSVLMPDRHPLAWKTGTSFHQRDAWALGVSPDWTVGVWAGNFSGEPSANLMGSRMAGQLLFQLYLQLPKAKGWFEKPMADLRAVRLCADTGYAPSPACPRAVIAEAPAAAAPLPPCPYHTTVIVANQSGREVCSLCWPPTGHHAESFLLFGPKVTAYRRAAGIPAQERPRHNPNCPAYQARTALQVLYPLPGSRLFLPRDYDGAAQDLVLRAAAPSTEALHWYVDQRYMGRTTERHHLPVRLTPGEHRLMVLDGEGHSASVMFEVVGRPAA
jgi:penicillin-binding protein 1C